MRHTMHLRPSVAKQPNLELKTQPKQLLGSLPIVIVLPGQDLRLLITFSFAGKMKLALSNSCSMLIYSTSEQSVYKQNGCVKAMLIKREIKRFWGAGKLMGDYLKHVWAEFSAIS
jgi:hypothetical protein